MEYQVLSILVQAIAALGQCIEAFVVTATAIIVIFQLKRLKEESIEHKVRGIDWILKYTIEDPYKTNITTFMSANIANPNEANIAMNALATILAEYDIFVDYMEIGYFDKEIIFKSTGVTMEKVLERMDILQHMPNYSERIERIKSFRPSAIKLLLESKLWMDKLRSSAK
jgi:hypothetical protein